jgi:hypothetical protein
MCKKRVLALTTAGAIAMAVPLAAAQDSQSADTANGQTNDQTAHTTSRAHERGCSHHHDEPDPARCTAELTAHLNFKVLSALQSESPQLQNVRQDTSLSREDARSKMRDIRTATESEIRGVLDSNQQKEWDEMQAWAPDGYQPTASEGLPRVRTRSRQRIRLDCVSRGGRYGNKSSGRLMDHPVKKVRYDYEN